MTTKTTIFARHVVAARAISVVWREYSEGYTPTYFYVFVRAGGKNLSERFDNKKAADQREAEIVGLMEAVQ